MCVWALGRVANARSASRAVRGFLHNTLFPNRPLETTVPSSRVVQAFSVFSVLVTRVVLAFDLSLYVPLSRVDANMKPERPAPELRVRHSRRDSELTRIPFSSCVWKTHPTNEAGARSGRTPRRRRSFSSGKTWRTTRPIRATRGKTSRPAARATPVARAAHRPFLNRERLSGFSRVGF